MRIKKEREYLLYDISVKFSLIREERIKISTPKEVYNIIKEDYNNLTQELFMVLCLNNKNKIIGKKIVSLGTISESFVHPREVFVSAIASLSSSIIVIHNHPSGDLTPSKEDLEATKRLKEAGKIIGIPLLDHIIVSDNNFVSLKDLGYL